jgi:nucleotide-binding universal stress UspA family protein
MMADSALFDRVVCGVDRSDAGLTAARVAGLVTAPAGSLILVSVYDRALAVHAGWRMAKVLEQLALEAKEALELGRSEAESLHALEGKLLEGDPLQCLLAEIAARDATTVVVGSHGSSRAAGIVLGAVSTSLLHDAPCSVLIARGMVDATRWPRRIVVGVDGSADSATAVEAATALAARFDAELRSIVATVDARVDLDAARRLAPSCEEHEGKALDILSVASEAADLLVVGSRGLRGIRALGSLSERLAHEARCPVLVARSPEARSPE